MFDISLKESKEAISSLDLKEIAEFAKVVSNDALKRIATLISELSEKYTIEFTGKLRVDVYEKT